MESGSIGPVGVSLPASAMPQDDDEGASDLFGDDDSGVEIQRSHRAMSEDEGSSERGTHAMGSGPGPAAHAGEGDPPTGGAGDSGHGSAVRKVEEIPVSLAERLCRVDLC